MQSCFIDKSRCIVCSAVKEALININTLKLAKKKQSEKKLLYIMKL